MSRRSSNTKSFKLNDPFNFLKKATKTIAGPLTNLFGINPFTSKDTKAFREYTDIRQKNLDRGYRKGKYYDYLDVEKDRKKAGKSFGKMLKPILPKNQEKTKKKKETITNKKGQKLTIIRPPIPRPNP
jgi:hypothetical protein